MTAAEYRRHRRWEDRCQPAYDAGFLEGVEQALMDLTPCPFDGQLVYDVRFVWRPSRRREQAIFNFAVARSCGRYDGYTQGKERMREDEWIEDGLAALQDYANRRYGSEAA